MSQAADSPGEKKRIQAVQTTLDIVDALMENGPMGVTELSNEIRVSKGTVYNHLATLEDNDFVYKDEYDKYDIGLRFIDVSHHAKSRVPILDLARTEVDKLAEKSGEMALFTVEEHGIGICLYVAYGDNAIKTPLYVGHQSELHHTAVGKAILAHLTEERLAEIIEQRGLPQVTENTITDEETLLEDLEEVRKRGIALNEEETIQGLVGVGSPVMSQDGVVQGALSIVGPSRRLTEDKIQRELPDMIMRSVNIIEVNSTTL